MTDYARPLLEPEQEPVTTGEALADLLHGQHGELRALLCRLPLLHDGAREDVFLRVRRLLAVHLELESALPERSGWPHERSRLEREVEQAEREGIESIAFDAAQARVAFAFLLHVGAQETLTMSGRLSEREESVVTTAVRLWDGGGDAYLGNTWSDMLAAVSTQLSAASDHVDGPSHAQERWPLPR